MRSLTDRLPLRSTTSLTQYHTVQSLPHIYGNCTVPVIPYSKNNRLHFIADHAILSVDAVRVDGKPIKSYQLHNTSDAEGKSVSLLELEIAAESQQISIDVGGKANADGEMIVNPADVVYDILNAIAGIDLDYNRLLEFKSQTSEIELAGLLGDSESSIRSTVNDLLVSIGAVWTMGSPRIALLYPGSRTDGLLIDLPNQCIESLSSYIRSKNELATIIKYEFNQDFYSNKPKATLTLRSETWQKYGELTRTVYAPWVRSARAALSISVRLAQYSSIPIYKSQLTVNFDEDLSPMDWMTVTHPNLPKSVNGEYLVINSSSSVNSLSYDLLIESITQPPPNVELIAQSELFEYTRSQFTYEYNDGVLTLTIFNTESGQLVKKASVTLLNQEKFTNELGQVQFKVDHGTYPIKLSAPGFNTVTSELTI